MYDYYAADSIAKQRHQDLINQAAHDALVRKQRRLNRPANRSIHHLLVSLTHLFSR